MSITFEMPEGPMNLQFSPYEAKKFRDALDEFIRFAEEQGFPVPIRE